MIGPLGLSIAWQGRDELFASFASVVEAMSNAHVEADSAAEVSLTADGIEVLGVEIVKTSQEFRDGRLFITLTPTSSMILFIGWVLSLLPSRATVRWQGGWAYVHCPPNDNRDHEEGPPPLVPNNLEPV